MSDNKSKVPDKMPFRRRNNNASAGVDLSSVINKGSSKIKKKIRDIKRLLKRDNLPSDLVIANERALKTLEGELENVEENKKVRKLISRYHKVRFFERKKAARHYKHELQVLKELKQKAEECKDTEEKEKIEEEIKKQEKKVHGKAVNFAYTLNFPETEKYVSLYRQNNPEDVEKMTYKEKKGLKKTEDTREKYKAEFSSQLKSNSLQVSLEEGLRHNGGGKRVYRKKRDGKDNYNNREERKEGKKNTDKEEEDDFFE